MWHFNVPAEIVQGSRTSWEILADVDGAYILQRTAVFFMPRRRVGDHSATTPTAENAITFEYALQSYWLARSRLSFKHSIHVSSDQIA